MSMRGEVTTRRPAGAPEGDALADAIRTHLAWLLRSTHFDASFRSREFLVYVVEEALASRSADLSQSSIATAVFGRSKADFDPILDPIVRVQAGRVRRALERYYLQADTDDEVRIELPLGSYAPVFRRTALGGAARHGVARRNATKTAESAWPAVLVHPLAIADTQDGDLAAQLEDELTRELCRHGDVRVVRQYDNRLSDRTCAAAQFELLVTLRREEDRLQIGARLIDRIGGQ